MKRLIDALKKCADAHKVEFKHYDEENQVGIFGYSVPLVADVTSIVHGFTGRYGPVSADQGWGCVTVYLDECEMLPDSEIDWAVIKMALPHDD